MNHTKTLGVAIFLVAAGCGGADTGPKVPPGPNTFQLVSGHGADTVGAILASPIVVQARSGDGKPRAGATIRFSVLTETPGTPFGVRLANMNADGSATVATQADGVASLQVTMGDKVGSFAVAVTETGVTQADTARFDVRAGALARVAVGTHDTMTTVGGAYEPAVSAFDRLDNPRSDKPALSSSDAMVCRADGAAIVGASVGNCTVFLSLGAFRDSILLAVVPANVHLLATVQGPIGGALLVSLNLDGSEYKVLRILNNSGFNPFHPVKSPAAPLIAVNEYGTDIRLHIMLIDEAGNERPLGATPGNEDNWARISSDGQWIYFSSRPDPSQAFRVWRSHLDGSGATPLTPVESSFGNHSNYADVTADGRTIAYGNQGLTLRTMDLVTGQVSGIQLAISTLKADPKLPRIAVLDYSYRLSLINADATGFRYVTADSVSGMLDWLPDGEWIMTRILLNLGNGFLMEGDRVLINVNTGKRVRLTYTTKLGEITVIR